MHFLDTGIENSRKQLTVSAFISRTIRLVIVIEISKEKPLYVANT